MALKLARLDPVVWDAARVEWRKQHPQEETPKPEPQKVQETSEERPKVRRVGSSECVRV